MPPFNHLHTVFSPITISDNRLACTVPRQHRAVPYRNNYTRSKLLEMLDNEGFFGQYNFVPLGGNRTCASSVSAFLPWSSAFCVLVNIGVVLLCYRPGLLKAGGRL